MALLEAKNIRKVYATRFGGNQVQALTDVSFTVDERIGVGQNDAAEHTGGT